MVKLRRVAVVALGVMVALSSVFYYPAPAFSDVSDPDYDFCPDSVATIAEINTDNDAGVSWSSSIFVPRSGGHVGIYFANNGPGPISFAFPAWSVNGTAIPIGESTPIPLTPKGSSATFNDLYWGGIFDEGVDLIGCTQIADIALPRGQQGTAHLDLWFYRGEELYSVRVNVHFQ